MEEKGREFLLLACCKNGRPSVGTERASTQPSELVLGIVLSQKLEDHGDEVKETDGSPRAVD